MKNDVQMISARGTQTQADVLETIGRQLLLALGQDTSTEALRDTPRRYAAAWMEFINYDPGNYDTTFEAVQADQLVVVSNMRVYSVCAHHLLPFWSDIAIGYITAKKVLGLSKFARIAQQHAHKLQVQEQLVGDIADSVQLLTESTAVAVLAQGVHLCMVMRGVRTDGVMTSSVMRGAFRTDAALRMEFMQLAAHAVQHAR